MQKNLKFIAAVAFAFLGIVVFVSQTFARFDPLTGADHQAAAIREIYVNNCARCHGVDGKGQTDLGRKYDVPDLTGDGKNTSKARIVRIIKNGKQDMPSFGKKLTKRQIDALASFVRRL
jgi:mono/diheme cytochrome c family protein